MTSLAQRILEEARALGFHRAGIAPAEPARRYQAFETWLDRGMHGTMGYLATPAHRAPRADVRHLLPTARSVVVVALAYEAGLVPLSRLTSGSDSGSDSGSGSGSGSGSESGSGSGSGSGSSSERGEVARYARGRDYHAVMKARLRQLATRIEELVGRPVASRPCVDTAPVLERELAERAGVGFVGKNNLVIAPGLGSYLLLGELLVDLELDATAGDDGDRRCGSCTRCLDACPTGAFDGAHVLDARRCISYLTIEHRGPIPRELRAAIGMRIFGCDVCQDVCPFNAAAPARTDGDHELARLADERRSAPELIPLLAMGPAKWRRFVGRTPLRRAGREGLLRNACVALGNAGDRTAIPALERSLVADSSPLVRGHAAWALGRLDARDALLRAHSAERDPAVLDEIDAALAAARPGGPAGS